MELSTYTLFDRMEAANKIMIDDTGDEAIPVSSIQEYCGRRVASQPGGVYGCTMLHVSRGSDLHALLGF